MNTKILLAMAGAVALSACSANKAVVVALPVTPSESANPALAKPTTPSRPSGDPGFRLPDPTEDLYPLRKTATTNRVPASHPANPLSLMPATPPARPVASPDTTATPPTPLSPAVGSPRSPEPVAAPND